MNKTIHPLDIKIGKQFASVFCHIEIKEGELSITGVIGPNKWGNARGGCGQIIMEFRDKNVTLKENSKITIHNWNNQDHEFIEEIRFNNSQKWNLEKFNQFLDVWDKWHLNHMIAGTRAQEDYLDTIKNNFPGYPVSHYEWASKELAKVGLNPDNGYFYGHAWLSEELPQEVIEFLELLPETDKIPAWV